MEKVSFKPVQEVQKPVEQLFEQQKKRIHSFFPEVEIEHIGSTSVPGSITKGDLDVVIRVQKEDFLAVVEKMKKLYKINQPKNWSETYASFKDTIKGIDFGAQVAVIGGEEDEFVRHREYLRRHPKTVERYNALKREFEGKDMNAYREKKAKFFDRIRKRM